MCRCGGPYQGGGFLLGAVPAAAARGRGLGDPHSSPRAWGERIDPGVAFGPPSRRHPRGLAAVPALPCLRQRCRSLRSSHLPGASHPPLPAQGSGRDAGDTASARAPHPSAGASLPILPAIEPRFLDDGPPSSSSAWLLGAPCRGAGRRGLRARRGRRCHHLSTQEPEQGQKVGGWAAAPGGRQWCQAGIGVRTSAPRGSPPSLFPFSSASLHPSSPPNPHHCCRGHLHPLAVFRNCSNFLPCDPKPGSSPRRPQADAGVSAEPPARRCAAATASTMGERCDYQRLSSAEEEEEVHGPLPHSFSDSTGQRALRLGSRRPTPPPRQDIAPGMPCRRVSGGNRWRGAAEDTWLSLMAPG